MKPPIAGLLAVVGFSAAASGQTYAIVIRNGHVLDGAGNPWIAAVLVNGVVVIDQQKHTGAKPGGCPL